MFARCLEVVGEDNCANLHLKLSAVCEMLGEMEEARKHQERAKQINAAAVAGARKIIAMVAASCTE